ncbi:hypothetical protein Tco_0488942 [Tanacetum coccineum]
MSKKSSPDPSQKLKGIQTLTHEVKLAADIMQALKESRKSVRSQPHAGGSSEGTSTKPRVPDKSTVTLITSSERTESEYTKEDDDDEKIEWVDTDEEEEKNDDDDDKSIYLEKTDDGETDDELVHGEEHVQDDDEETDDEVVHGDEQVNDEEDEEMTNAEDAGIGHGDAEITDVAKADAEKTKEVKDDIKEAEFPPLSSSLSVSSGFGNQFLNLSSDKSTVGNLKDSADAEINSLLDVQIQQEIPHIQSSSILNVHVFVIFEPSVITPVFETPSVAPATSLLPHPSVYTIPHVPLQSTTPIPTPLITTDAPSVATIPDLLHAVIQRVSVLEKDVQELKEADNTTTLHALLKSEIPSAVNAYLRSSLGDALHKSTVKNALEETSLLLAPSSSLA